MAATLDLKGLGDAEKALHIDVAAIVDPVMEKAARRMQAELMDYPAPPPSSTYVRTGTLGRSWQVEGGNMLWRIGNNTTYAPEVQGELQTAAHERTGWKTAESVLADAEDDLVSDIEQALQKAVGSGN